MCRDKALDCWSHAPAFVLRGHAPQLSAQARLGLKTKAQSRHRRDCAIQGRPYPKCVLKLAPFGTRRNGANLRGFCLMGRDKALDCWSHAPAFVLRGYAPQLSAQARLGLKTKAQAWLAQSKDGHIRNVCLS